MMFIINFICNMFIFLSFDTFITYFTHIKKFNKYIIYKGLFVIFTLIFSFFSNITYGSIICLLSFFIYLFYVSDSSLVKKIKVFFIYCIYFFTIPFLIFGIHTLLIQDISILNSNKTYFSYKTIICSALLYIIISMYIVIKELSLFPTGKIYKLYFSLITVISVLLLTVCSMLLGSTIIQQEYILPILFLLLIIITVLFIYIYRKIINILKENTLNKIEAEKNALQKDYYTNVENNLKLISLLRHDFRNHMIILEGYAKQGETDKLLEYIHSIHNTLVPTALIQTPSPLLSSLLNAKNEDCKARGVILQFQHLFPSLEIDDFHLVTILSNLLDNAITAAAKCEKGIISLSMTQLDSYLEIDCVNPHMEVIHKKGDMLLTTKAEQKEIHGLGITSMRKAVEQLNGKITVDYTTDIFHVNILVPNYK